MDIGRTLSKNGAFPPPVKAVRHCAGLSQYQLSAAIQCPPGEISDAERGRKWLPRLRRCVWFCYLLYLHRDPEWGWLRAALLLPPATSPDTPITGYSDDEMSLILSRLSRTQAQLVREKIDRDSGRLTEKQVRRKRPAKRVRKPRPKPPRTAKTPRKPKKAGGSWRPGGPGRPPKDRSPAPIDDDEDVRPG